MDGIEDHCFHEGLVATGDVAEGREYDGEVGVGEGVVEGTFGRAGREAGGMNVRRELLLIGNLTRLTL